MDVRRLARLQTCGKAESCPHRVSAPADGGWILGFQALFEAAEQDPVAFVLLVLPGVKLALDLEAAVHDEGRGQHRELVAGHEELAALGGVERR